MLTLGAQLHTLGHPVSFALREENPNLCQALPPHIPCILWDDLHLSPEHCWLIPEGWPQALLLGLHSKARCVVYVQNWAYFLSNLPQNIPFDRLPLRCLAVSEPVRHFIHYTTRQDCPVLRPYIDPALFYPLPRAAGAAHSPADGPLRVAYMPRKNTALARYIREAVSARLHYAHPHISLEWIEIHHKSPQEVAQLLRESHIFLATGFPEGLGLPPLEAMASGCIVVGFAGMGGWDYMRPMQAQDASYIPYCPTLAMRPVAWGANGFYAADADVLGAAQALEQACLLLYKGGPELAALRESALQCAAAYSPQQHAADVQALWRDWL